MQSRFRLRGGIVTTSSRVPTRSGRRLPVGVVLSVADMFIGTVSALASVSGHSQSSRAQPLK